MQKIIVGFVGLMVVLLPCQLPLLSGVAEVLAAVQGIYKQQQFGGSSSHSYGSSSHGNAYGGSTSHTAGQGTTHDSAYGTSTSHNEGGGTLARTPTAVKLRVNTEKARRARTLTAAKRRLNTEKVRPTRTYMAAALRRLRRGRRPHRRLMATTLSLVSSANGLLRLSSACHGELLRINMRQLQRLGRRSRCHNGRCYWCGCRFSKCKR